MWPVGTFCVMELSKTRLYLSDSYLEKTSHPMLELKVKMININLPEGHPLLERCRPLYEYSWFTWKVREYLGRSKDRDEAIARAMEASVRAGILTEFIQRHGSEVRNMLYTEFNLEDAREVWEEEAREDGLRQGRAEGADRILTELVIKKPRRGKSLEAIAGELETSVGKIRDIHGFVAPFAPDYDLEAIFTAMGKIDK